MPAIEDLQLGPLIDLRIALKREKAAVAATMADVETRIEEVEGRIKMLMVASGLNVAAGSTGRVSLNETDMPNVRDWEAFHQYVRDHNAFYLLQKRVAATAFREERQANGDIPGVEVTPVKTLSISTT